jgi:dipeptidyl aminopeptidase/acylaminoacyl peptidase
VGAPVWSPDGRRLVSSSNNTLFVRTLDGSAPDQMLVKEEGRTLTPTDWLRDGRIVYGSSPDGSRFEIKVLDPGAAAGRLILPAGTATEPDVSPDGRWIAYTSAQTGVREIFVQAFPGPGARTQISAGGGRNPAWSSDGRTVFYLDAPPPGLGGSKLLAVQLGAAPDGAVHPGAPREILRHRDGQGCVFARCYDVAADGRRFLFRDRKVITRKTVSRMDLVVNLLAVLQNPK